MKKVLVFMLRCLFAILSFVLRTFFAGFMAVFALGVIGFLVKLVVFDIIAGWLNPFVITWLGNDAWATPVSVGLTIGLCMILGLILSHVKLREVINSVMERLSPKGELGVLLRFQDGMEYFAIKIKQITQKNHDSTRIRFVLFAPYAPVPGSGLPIILADKDKVIPLKLTLRQIISIIVSFGRNVPDLLETNNKSAD